MPVTDARTTRRAEAEERFARGPRPTASNQATPEALQELQVHQIELEKQNEELRQAMQALEEAHDRYASLYEFAPVGYVTVNADGTISEVNRAGEPIFGVGRSLLQKARERQAAAVRLRRLEEELRASQAQLAAAARLASLGTLVARVAQKITIPLASILADHGMALAALGTIRQSLRGTEPLDPEAGRQHLDALEEGLDEAQAAARRIERIVQDLRLYGRIDAPKQLERLTDIMDQAVRWVPSAVRRAATIRVENAGAPDVIVSIGQIVQVVVNLLVNAAKAVGPGRPCLVIARIGPGAPGMARLEVIDEGAGLDPRALSRVFDPVFTSGGQGEGMELALAACHAIVTAHGGTLTVVSKVGTGSTFRMELPAATAG